MRHSLITVLCSSSQHPIWPKLAEWVCGKAELVQSVRDAHGGDILFLISCSEIVKTEIRARYNHTLVIHAADLPRGRGWSPHVWAVLEGRDEFTVTLLEAADGVDSGPIWKQEKVRLDGTELHDEINDMLFAAELRLMDYAVKHAKTVKPRTQQGDPSYYRRRTTADSELDIHRSIDDQFNLLRVCDPDRYPAYFVKHGVKYTVTVRKA